MPSLPFFIVRTGVLICCCVCRTGSPATDRFGVVTTPLRMVVESLAGGFPGATVLWTIGMVVLVRRGLPTEVGVPAELGVAVNCVLVTVAFPGGSRRTVTLRLRTVGVFDVPGVGVEVVRGLMLAPG